MENPPGPVTVQVIVSVPFAPSASLTVPLTVTGVPSTGDAGVTALETVGTGGCVWYAPRSTGPGIGRGRPRWSVVTPGAPGATASAGLLGRSARVGVGPPLSWRVPRPAATGLAFVPTMLLEPVIAAPAPVPIRQ
jgi:hypothetical protein